MRTLALVSIVGLVSAVATAQDSQPQYSIETIGVQPGGAGQPSAQPSPGEQREGPDGTAMSVIASHQHTLVVEDLKVGEGAECERRSEIVVHYHGTLADGSVFDTTRGKPPATFALNRLIPGWQAGLPGMKAGGVRRLVVPAAMAYGATDRKDASGKVTIPANSELTFTIQLVEVRTPVTKPSGLVVTELVIGTGKECPPGGSVKVHYRGTLADGREFDSSYARQEPIEFQLAGLIKGWQEGIPGMKVGGKRKLVVPYHLAYGEAGSPPTIPGYATLTFEIELLDVK